MRYVRYDKSQMLRSVNVQYSTKRKKSTKNPPFPELNNLIPSQTLLSYMQEMLRSGIYLPEV